jgi:hypothetical protein
MNLAVKVGTEGEPCSLRVYGDRSREEIINSGVVLLRDDGALFLGIGNLAERSPMSLRELLQVADALRRLLVPDANPEELAAIVSGMEAEIVEEGKP